MSTIVNKISVSSNKNEKDKLKVNSCENVETIENWKININEILRSLMLCLVSFIFIVLKIFLMLYQSVKSFIFLVGCFLRQSICYCNKNKKLKRNGSGFLEHTSNLGKLHLILDLDNTLVFSSMNKIEKAKNYAIMDNKFYVYKRPHLDNFLSTLAQFCELIIYTAGTKEYADKIIDHIDKNKFISKRLYRQDCLNVGSFWYKDASKCFYDEREVVIIDDIPNCHLSYKSKFKNYFR
jgi:RNA polymerase II subunit A small phosphatase-like protein